MSNLFSVLNEVFESLQSGQLRLLVRRFGGDVANFAGEGVLNVFLSGFLGNFFRCDLEQTQEHEDAGSLLNEGAFDLIAQSDFEPERKVSAVSLLSRYAGKDGMIRGQALDMQFEGRKVSLDQLIGMDELKTGRLLTLPLLFALVLSGNEDKADMFTRIGRDIGIAFQIQDDILDVTSTAEQLGKSTSDLENEKVTYVSLLGLEEARSRVSELFDDVYSLLGEHYPQTAMLLKKIENRTW